MPVQRIVRAAPWSDSEIESVLGHPRRFDHLFQRSISHARINHCAGAPITTQSRIRPAIFGLVLASALALSGCLLDSPYWNQEFESHTDQIPIQAFTTVNSSAVKFECAKAFHGGLYPDASSAVWTLVQNVTPQAQPLYDPDAGKIYGAGVLKVLPAACWRFDPGNSLWYGAIRATQVTSSGTTTYMTFDAAGLACLGTAVGTNRSWFSGWTGCTKKYLNSTTPINYVIFRAVS